MTRWFCGDADAVNFAVCLWHGAQAWDDLEDEGSADHNALISWMAFTKEYHPFFARHGSIMRPAMLSMYLKWRVANVLDRGTRDDVAKSYMLRAGLYDVWHLMAWLTGGEAWAAEVGPEIYREYSETPDSLWKEMNNA